MSKLTEDVPYKCDTFSVEEIKAANARHDRRNGWHPSFAHCYTNLMRHPESTLAPAHRAFERVTNAPEASQDALERDLPRSSGENAQTHAAPPRTPQIKRPDGD